MRRWRGVCKGGRRGAALGRSHRGGRQMFRGPLRLGLRRWPLIGSRSWLRIGPPARPRGLLGREIGSKSFAMVVAGRFAQNLGEPGVGDLGAEGGDAARQGAECAAKALF
eukprot:8380208-Pyramimonas_sp.AAC.1